MITFLPALYPTTNMCLALLFYLVTHYTTIRMCRKAVRVAVQSFCEQDMHLILIPADNGRLSMDMDMKLHL